MTWPLANQDFWAATDVRPIVGNLFQFFEDNQTGALAWASPGRTLTPFTNFYRTAQMFLENDYPHFGLIKRTAGTTNANSGLVIDYQLTWQFEVYVNWGTLDRTTAINQLQADVDAYGYAVESMFMNCPNATLFNGVAGARHGFRALTRTDPLERAIGDTEALFNIEQRATLNFTENLR